MNIFVNVLVFFIVVFGLLCVVSFMILFILYFFKKGRFPKKTFIVSCMTVGTFVLFLIYNQYFLTFNRMNDASLQFAQGPIESASGKYTATSFFEPYGGIVGGFNYVVNKDVETGEEKVIYYADAKSFTRIAWDFDDGLNIMNEQYDRKTVNDNMTLKPMKEIYHDKGLVCQSLLIRKSYEKCYQNESDM